MPYGCSVCVCIAIEARRPRLLRKLLARRDIQYRDMFWAPKPPPERTRANPHVPFYEHIPVLYHCGPDDDLSFVGRADCGHEHVDVELCAPLKAGRVPFANILVSVPVFAKWHSTPDFEAERIVRMSGLFDLSAPQFFHVLTVYTPHAMFLIDDGDDNYDNDDDDDDADTPSDSESSEDMTDEPDAANHFASGGIPCAHSLDQLWPVQVFSHWQMRIWFEDPTDPKPEARAGSAPGNALEPKRVRRSCDHVEVEGRCSGFDLELVKSYSRLRSFFDKFCDGIEDTHSFLKPFGNGSEFQKELKKMLQSGADLNHCFTFKHLLLKGNGGVSVRHCRVCSPNICQYLFTLMPLLHEDTEWIYQMLQLVQFLLRNGLSFFLGDRVERDVPRDAPSLLEALISVSFQCDEIYAFGRSIAAQLLALGYGRRELHPADATSWPFDEHLDATRRKAEDKAEQWIRDELRALVASFDSGPLSLLQLSRIAVRRAVGGADFARRVRKLSSRLPPALMKYVSDPTELMTTEKKLRSAFC